MKNVIYFCIGFMLLLIYRKYRERMGLLEPSKGVSTDSSDSGVGTTVRSWALDGGSNNGGSYTSPNRR